MLFYSRRFVRKVTKIQGTIHEYTHIKLRYVHIAGRGRVFDESYFDEI